MNGPGAGWNWRLPLPPATEDGVGTSTPNSWPMAAARIPTRSESRNAATRRRQKPTSASGGGPAGANTGACPGGWAGRAGGSVGRWPGWSGLLPSGGPGWSTAMATPYRGRRADHGWGAAGEASQSHRHGQQVDLDALSAELRFL